MDNVDELVEWVAEQINKIPQDGYKYSKDCAIQILSHPDLTLIDRGSGRNTPPRGSTVCANCWISTQNDMLTAGFEKVILLAEALKGKDGD